MIRESVSNLLRKVADGIYRTENIAAPPPWRNFIPVNEPGASEQMRPGWYRTVNGRGENTGFMFLCRCGQSNVWGYGPDDIRRKLEPPHYCSAHCTSIVWKERPQNGQPGISEQVRHTVTDEHGNVIPVGAPYSLLDLLPERGAHMSEHERNLAYATLPTFRIGRPAQAASPIQLIGDHGGDDGTQEVVSYEQDDPGKAGLF